MNGGSSQLYESVIHMIFFYNHVHISVSHTQSNLVCLSIHLQLLLEMVHIILTASFRKSVFTFCF